MTRGFTLIELLVAGAIIAILIAIAVPATGSMLAKARSAECLGHLRQIGVALNGYLAEHDQRMPELAAGRSNRAETDPPTLDVVLADYVGGDTKVFACPADRTLAAATGTSYLWNNALNGQAAGSLNFLRIFEARASIPVVSDKEGWHTSQRPKVNILFADGHAGREFHLHTGP